MQSLGIKDGMHSIPEPSAYSGDTDPPFRSNCPPLDVGFQRTRVYDKITVFFLSFHLSIQSGVRCGLTGANLRSLNTQTLKARNDLSIFSPSRIVYTLLPG